MTRKGARLLLIVAATLLVLMSAGALIVNRYRDAIALEVARSALKDTGVTVKDVSVGSIGSSEVLFDAIVLEPGGGSTVFIEGVTLPVRMHGLRSSTLHVERVRYVPGSANTARSALAAALQGYLDAPDAPDAMPGATVRIDRLILPGLPAIRDFAWHADPLNPTLQATVGEFDVIVTTTELPGGAHRGSVRALLADDTEALMASLLLTPETPGFQVDGTVAVLLEPLLPALQAVAAVPAEVTALNAVLDGSFGFHLDADAALPIEIRAVLDAAPGAALTYQADDNAVVVSSTRSADIVATLEYPSLDWTATVAQASLQVAGTGVAIPPIHLRDTVCRSGVHCRSALETAFDDVALGELSIDRVSVRTATAEVSSRDGNWNAKAPDTRLALQRPAFGGRLVVAPAIRADVSGSNDKVATTVHLSSPEGGLGATAEISHDLVQDRGEMSLHGASIEFDKLKLSGIFPGWPYDWDIEGGRAAARADVRWNMADDGLAYEGTASITADSLAGHYADIGFLGFGTRLDVGLNSDAPLELQPARFDVALVDVGFPVEDISGTATPLADEPAVAVSALSMKVLGGTVTADAFRFDPGAERNELTLRASGIQLPLMAGLADLETVTISGSVSGEIPVTIRGNQIIIENGHLENDPPGGVIRYGGGAADAIVDNGSQLGIVTRTLQNFEFDSLTSAVSYSQDGDLVLGMRLKGVNPDVDPTQPVILNLNVENNVPQMLRSLQATRSIEDVLERRLSK